jgi:hypothetical protein
MDLETPIWADDSDDLVPGPLDEEDEEEGDEDDEFDDDDEGEDGEDETDESAGDE